MCLGLEDLGEDGARPEAKEALDENQEDERDLFAKNVVDDEEQGSGNRCCNANRINRERSLLAVTANGSRVAEHCDDSSACHEEADDLDPEGLVSSEEPSHEEGPDAAEADAHIGV